MCNEELIDASSRVDSKKKYLTRTVALMVCVLPMVALGADWDQKMVDVGRSIRLGMYAVGGSIALSTMVWSGIQWLISRASGDHQHSFVDYMKQAGVVLAVGGSIVLGAAAWQIFGSGNPT